MPLGTHTIGDAPIEPTGLDRRIDAFLAGFPPFGSYHFELSALEPISLPPFAGSAWRGLLGHGLRRTVCVTRQPTCQGCLLVGSCVYSTLFESPPLDPADQARYTAVPHPFVLRIDTEGPLELPPQARFGMGLQLFGPASGHLPYIVHALSRVGERGIGRGYGHFRLERVWQLPAPDTDWVCIHDAGGSLDARPLSPASTWAGGRAPEQAHLRLQTPLRMKRRGDLVGPREFQLREFLRQLLWRLNDLSHHYGTSNRPLDETDLAAAIDRVSVLRSALHWRDWTRYSSRQDALMQLGGLVGEFELGGEGLALLWPLLRLGQWTHLGKATSMGLGQYRIEAAASLRPQPSPGQARILSGVGEDG